MPVGIHNTRVAQEMSGPVVGSATILFRKLFDAVEVTDAFLNEILSYPVDVDWVDACLQTKRCVAEWRPCGRLIFRSPRLTADSARRHASDGPMASL